MTPVVRIPQAGTGIIKQLLDAGIQNIIIPKVETGEETENIMYWASYAPRGNRGFGATAVRAGYYGRHADCLERNVDEICILPQIESKRGLDNMEAIAMTPEQAKHFAELGVSFLALGADTGFLVNAADNALKTFKGAIES